MDTDLEWFVAQIGALSFQPDVVKKRFSRTEPLRGFLYGMCIAEHEYYQANFGATGRRKDVQQAYSDAFTAVTNLLVPSSRTAGYEPQGDDRAVVQQLRKLVQLRMQLVNFYRDLVEQSQKGPIDYKHASSEVAVIERTMLGYLQHPALRLLKAHAEYELAVLQALFDGFQQMAEFRYRETTYRICRAKTLLINWEQHFIRERATPDPQQSKPPIPGLASGPDSTPRRPRASSHPHLTPRYGEEEDTSRCDLSPPVTPNFRPTLRERFVTDVPPSLVSTTPTPTLSPPPPAGVGPSQAKLRHETALSASNLFRWLKGLFHRCIAKYCFLFNTVLHDCRERIYPYLPPVTLWTRPSTDALFALQRGKPLRKGPGMQAILQRIQATERPWGIQTSLDYLKRTEDFCRKHPSAAVLLILDTSPLAFFSPHGFLLAPPASGAVVQPTEPNPYETPVGSMCSVESYSGQRSPGPVFHVATNDSEATFHPQGLEVAAGIMNALSSTLPNAVADDVPPRSISPTIAYNSSGKAPNESYRFPRVDEEAFEPKRGVRAFQLLSAFPKKVPFAENQWATLISIILANGPRLMRDPSPIQLEDHAGRGVTGDASLLSTYFISQLDTGLFAAVVFERQKANAKTAVEYLRNVAVSMRQCTFLEYLLMPKKENT